MSGLARSRMVGDLVLVAALITGSLAGMPARAGVIAGGSVTQAFTIGSGMETNHIMSAGPINIYYQSRHFQFVYTTNDLADAGLVGPVEIVALGLDVVQAPDYNLPNFQIRMKHTMANDMSGGFESAGLEDCYNNASYAPAAGGFDMLAFAQPFTWNGTNNLIIDTAFAPAATYTASGRSTYDPVTACGRYLQGDGFADQSDVFTDGFVFDHLPRIRVLARTVTAVKAPQTISFPNPGLQVVTNQTPITATATSGLPVSLEVVSGAEHLIGPIGPISPISLGYQSPGLVTLRATQAGDADWQAAAAVEITFRVRADRVPYADFNGDGRSDLTVFYPAGGLWYLIESTTGQMRQQNWGWHETVPVPADYDGDGKVDLAVYYPAGGLWYIIKSTTGQMRQQAWGWSETQPVPGDYDGDGITDLAVYHQAKGDWYIIESATGTVRKQAWGWSETVPVPGDYDGDGITDLAVYYPAGGLWYILESTTGQMRQQAWGWSETQPVPGDYDGDGITDLAVYHQAKGDWYIIESATGTVRQQNWGWHETVPVPGDYDGDGITDLAVYDQLRGNWYIIKSATSTTFKQNWGWSETQPVWPLWR